MSKTVMCVKLQKELPALERSPVPGELGKRILDQVSKEAWQGWLGHQTMLINEYHLSLVDPSARSFLTAEMEKYFFTNEEVAKPEGYRPQE